MDGELLSLKWNNHRTTFYHVICGLRNKETYTDVTLACEGKFYPVHKLVLSTCSEYFSDIFDRTPCKNPVVVLKDIHCQDLEFLLDYMYIGEVNVRQNELSSLIKAAECLRIKGLAVPDEEPKKGASATSGSNASGTGPSRQRPEQSSPPAKRRRGEERRPADLSPDRPPGDAQASPDQDTNSVGKNTRSGEVNDAREQPAEDKQTELSEEHPAVHIKVEQDNFEQPGNDDFLSVQSNNYDGGGEEGDGQRGSEGNTSDFPEFLQSTIEKEEPVAMSDFNPSDFPGPSGLQNSGMAPWESENSSASFGEGISGAVAAAVAAASQPQQQRQQQQLMSEVGLLRPLVGSGVATSAGASTLVCPMCRFSTSCNLLLNQHVRRHHDGWPSACPHCDYRTHRSHDLKKHLRTHTGEKPYHCSLCSYQTSDPSNLSAHLKNRHSAAIRIEDQLPV